jgi:RimJ/RimL family protein N-acetyltransferase
VGTGLCYGSGSWCALAFGFGELGLEEIVSFTAASNTRSRALMHRLGMKHVAADDFDHPRLPEAHALRRHVLYRLTDSTLREAERGGAHSPRTRS